MPPHWWPLQPRDVLAERDQFGRISACKIDIAGRRTGTVLVSDVAPFEPTQLLKCLAEHRVTVFAADTGEDTDAPHPLRLLRARRQRPRRRAAEQSDELAPSHSITSSARASRVEGTSRPSTLAAWALITSSNLLACMTGKSAGLAPLRMRPA